MKRDGTTIAINGDMLEIIKGVQEQVPQYELLELPKLVQRLILEGCNRIHGDAINTDYIKVMQDLKLAK